MNKDFTYYRECFEHLHTNVSKGRPAPHKPLLLLSVMDLIERGVITSSRISLSEQLINAFNLNASKYLGHSLIFRPEICKPFYHLNHEPFWNLIRQSDYNSNAPISIASLDHTLSAAATVADNSMPEYKSSKTSGTTDNKSLKMQPRYNVKWLREQYKYALIDHELFLLLCNSDARAKLRVVLISTYFTDQPNRISPVYILPIVTTLLSSIVS
ncbi:MAG: hypothetical protein K2M67_07885 [Muribaculaceae bacterium]|nr:hypothetical protein [Muribaculaceae bacterium]